MGLELDVLKAAKKKKRLTVRDFNYGYLEDMVKQGLLDKIFSRTATGRSDGWVSYQLTRKGRRSLEKTLAQIESRKNDGTL